MSLDQIFERNVTVVPPEISKQIAEQNPGRGYPLSSLPTAIQKDLRNGVPVSIATIREYLPKF